ncbi:MAG: RNA-binding protein [Erysipelotrichaceae bacterium]
MDKKTKVEAKKRYPQVHDLIDRISDWSNQAIRYKKACYSAFLLPNERMIVEALLPNFVITWSGTGQDTMCVGMIAPTEQTPDFPICLLKAKYNNKFRKIEHRDVLGALMNLGIERDQFGDIYVEEATLYVYVLESIAPYVMQQLIQIGKSKVTFEVSQDDVRPSYDLEESQKIVTSLRLDVIVAALTNLSRDKAQSLIRSGLVKLAYSTIEDVSKLCHNGNDISIRGYGRFIFYEVVKTTKKDNMVIRVAKYR